MMSALGASKFSIPKMSSVPTEFLFTWLSYEFIEDNHLFLKIDIIVMYQLVGFFTVTAVPY